MESDNTSEQLTIDTDQSPRTDFVFYAEQPERQAELKESRRRGLLVNTWLIVSTIAIVGLVLTVGRFVPSSILWGVVALLLVSSFAQAQAWRNIIDRLDISRNHYWQDRIDHIWRDAKRYVFDPLAAFADKTLYTTPDVDKGIDQLVTVANEEFEQERRTARQQGKGRYTGRPELTREDWIERGLKIAQVEGYYNPPQVSWEQACARAGVIYSTFRDWRKKIPADCLDEARAQLTRN